MKKILIVMLVLLFGRNASATMCIFNTKPCNIIGATPYNGTTIFQPFTTACLFTVEQIDMAVVMPSSNGNQVFAAIYDKDFKVIESFKNIKENGGYVMIDNMKGLQLSPGDYYLGFWSNKNGPAWVKTDCGYWGSISGECVVPEPSTVILCGIGIIFLGVARGLKNGNY